MKKVILGLMVAGVVNLMAVDMCRHYATQLNDSINDAKKAFKEGLKTEERRAWNMVSHYTNQTIIACPEGSATYKFGKAVQKANKELGLQ